MLLSVLFHEYFMTENSQNKIMKMPNTSFAVLVHGELRHSPHYKKTPWSFLKTEWKSYLFDVMTGKN